MSAVVVERLAGYDDISDAELSAVVRVFGAGAAGRIFDVALPKVEGRVRAYERAAERRSRESTEEEDGEIDLFFLKKRVGALLKPYLTDASRFSNAKDRKETLNLAIQFYDLTTKTAKIVQDFVDTREVITVLLDGIKGTADRMEIVKRWKSDPRLKELM